MKLNVKNENGFTLVELRVVVAIMGVLSAVAIPNFQKYQAKAKTSEAKVQLAAAYTAEQAFFGDFGIFATCLNYMGYDPSDEAASRYFAVGFNVANAIDGAYNAGTGVGTLAYGSAVNSGMSASSCADGAAAANGVSFFVAGKQIGSAPAALVVTGATLGTQAGDATNTFDIVAQGIVSSKAVACTASTPDCSIWSMNEDKVITNVSTGY
jgi:type IV pilus assembly protein PilA